MWYWWVFQVLHVGLCFWGVHLDSIRVPGGAEVWRPSNAGGTDESECRRVHITHVVKSSQSISEAVAAALQPYITGKQRSGQLWRSPQLLLSSSCLELLVFRLSAYSCCLSRSFVVLQHTNNTTIHVTESAVVIKCCFHGNLQKVFSGLFAAQGRQRAGANQMH